MAVNRPVDEGQVVEYSSLLLKNYPEINRMKPYKRVKLTSIRIISKAMGSSISASLELFLRSLLVGVEVNRGRLSANGERLRDTANLRLGVSTVFGGIESSPK